MPDNLKVSERCTFYPYEGSSNEQEFLMRTPGGRQFRLSPLAKEILEKLDGSTSLETISRKLQARNINIDADGLQHFLEQEYGSLGVFENYDAGSSPAVPARKSPIPIFLHWGLIPSRFSIRIGNAVNWLFNRFVVIAVMLAAAGAHYWVYRIQLPALRDDETEVNLIAVILLALISVLVHEFGHSSAVTRYGGSPGPIGFGLYALMPAFYADVSEIWRFPRRQRMVVDSAGVYFQQVVFCIYAGVGYITGISEFVVAGTVLDTMVLWNLNPLFQFDGYWFLVDYLGLPELHKLVWAQFKRWFVRSKEAPALPLLSRRKYLIFLGYAIGSIGFIALLLRIEYRYAFYPSVHFLAGLPKLFQSLVGAFKAREFLRLSGQLVRVLLIAIAPLSIITSLAIYASRAYHYFLQRGRTGTPY